MKTVTLNNGITMPIIGFGVYKLDDPIACEQAVIDAISSGYRLIDTAAAYINEESVGNAIKKSPVPREQLFVTTKLWIQDQGYEPAKKAFNKSLNRLGLDYIDLYLIHQPYGDSYGSWRAMQELYKEGKIRAIGVSNFSSNRLVDFILNNEIPPAVNQIEIHPFYQRTDAENIMKEMHVQAESWGPFARGRNGLFENETLLAIAAKYNKSVAQIVLRWLIQQDIVAIPKSSSKARMVENISIFDFEIALDDMETIKMLDSNTSFFDSNDDLAAIRHMNERHYDI